MTTPPRVKAATPVMATGVILFLVSEFFLFGGLFFAYYYLKFVSAAWPPPDVHLSLVRPVFNTVLLLGSSFTMLRALSAWRRGDRTATGRNLLLTISLGVLFLGVTVWEWLAEGFRPWSHAYGSLFFTLTGFHALHVLGGVLLLSALANRNRLGLLDKVSPALELGSWYWHYVDAIWLLVFTTLFIVR